MSKKGIFIAIGSNMGDRLTNINQSLVTIENHKDIMIMEESHIYETKPYGVLDQPDFLNMVIRIETSCTPLELLQRLKWIEQKIGRVQGERWGPRVVDLDILFYNQVILNYSDLIIPHVDLHNRDFVLVPMAEIEPEFVHPVFNKDIEKLLAEYYTASIK